MNYGTHITLDAPFGEAVARVRAALAGQGFGVLTEIDVTATMRAKLGEQMEDYVILGACNPPFAHQALGIDRSIGLLLPCNVVVRAGSDGTVVEALDPQVMRFFATVPADGRLDTIRLVRTRANGHPALAAYLPGKSARCEGYGIMVFTATDDGIATITGFPSPDLFERFGLPVIYR